MRAVTVAVWAILVAAALLLEALGRRRTAGLVPAKDIVRGLVRAPAGRAILAIGWMWLGWHLFAR